LSIGPRLEMDKGSAGARIGGMTKRRPCRSGESIAVCLDRNRERLLVFGVDDFEHAGERLLGGEGAAALVEIMAPGLLVEPLAHESAGGLDAGGFRALQFEGHGSAAAGVCHEPEVTMGRPEFREAIDIELGIDQWGRAVDGGELVYVYRPEIVGVLEGADRGLTEKDDHGKVQFGDGNALWRRSGRRDGLGSAAHEQKEEGGPFHDGGHGAVSGQWSRGAIDRRAGMVLVSGFWFVSVEAEFLA